MLKFNNSDNFRYRLVLATLSGRTVRIENIRSQSTEPGLKDFEVGFLRLLEKVTNGSQVEINYTGTTIVYKPGVIQGGKITHDCGASRSIGYFLEPLVALAPFAKIPFQLQLMGITNDNQDLSVDTLRTVTLRHLNKFGITPVELKVVKRGAPPLGGGEINFKCGVVRQLTPIRCLDIGRIKRIRGIAYATRVSPQTCNRVVESARSILNRYIPDIYIYTDVFKGNESGKSPGYGLTLVAESTTGAIVSSEQFADAGQSAEDLGVEVAKKLLTLIQDGGYVDPFHHALHFTLLTVTPEDVSKIKLGKLNEYSIQHLKDLNNTFNTKFKIETKDQSLEFTGLGTGFTNVSKKTN